MWVRAVAGLARAGRRQALLLRGCSKCAVPSLSQATVARSAVVAANGAARKTASPQTQQPSCFCQTEQAVPSSQHRNSQHGTRRCASTAAAQLRDFRQQQPHQEGVRQVKDGGPAHGLPEGHGAAVHANETGVRDFIRQVVDNGRHKATGVQKGLLCNPLLETAEGFKEIEEGARARTNKLVSQVLSNYRSGKHEHALQLVDHVSHTLCKVLDLCEFVLQVHPDENYRRAAEETLYALGRDMEELNTNVELYQSLKAFEDMPSLSTADQETKYTVRSLLFDFEKCGIHLPDRKRESVVSRVVELEQLRHLVEHLQTTVVGQDAKIALRDVPPLPPVLRGFIRETSNESFAMVPFSDPNFSAQVLMTCASRSFRERADRHRHEANPELDDALLKLLLQRHELATLVGFEDYAHKDLTQSMAQSPAAVREFLKAGRASLEPLIAQEMDVLRELAPKFGIDEELREWDMPFLMLQARRSHSAASQTAAYFTLGNCFAGIDLIIHRLFGLRLEPRTPEPGEVWHDDVIRFDVVGEEDGVIGTFYCDLFMRKPKNTHPSHYTIRSGRRLTDGPNAERERPICALVCGFPKNIHGLVYQQAATLFHEFGHALHSLLSDTTYQHVAGTRGPFDFAELPSTLFERFLRDYDLVSQFAVHPATKAPISRELHTAALQEAQQFSAIDTQQALFLAALDQHYHSNEFVRTPDLLKGLTDINSEYLTTGDADIPRYRTFRHLTSYASSYYSYPWCQALAAFLWSECFEGRPLDRDVGERYREHILAPGSSGNEWRRIEHMIGFKPSLRDLAEGLTKP